MEILPLNYGHIVAEYLLSKASFARQAQVSAMAVTKLINGRNHKGVFIPGKLADSFDGKFINVTHKDVREYLKSRGLPSPDMRSFQKRVIGRELAFNRRKAAGLYEPAREPGHKASGPVVSGNTGDVSDYLDMTLRDLVDEFGTDNQFVEWLKATKSIEDIREKRLKNDERESKYIPREIVEKVISEFERCFSLQLNDATKTIAARIFGYAQGGRSREEATQLAEDQIGAPIKDAKKRLSRWLEEYGFQGGDEK